MAKKTVENIGQDTVATVNYHNSRRVVELEALLGLLGEHLPGELFRKAAEHIDSTSSRLQYTGFLYQQDRGAVFLRFKYNSVLGVMYAESQIR